MDRTAPHFASEPRQYLGMVKEAPADEEFQVSSHEDGPHWVFRHRESGLHVISPVTCHECTTECRFEAACGGIEVFLEVVLFWPYFGEPGEPLYHPVWFPHSCSTVSGVEFEIISFVSWQAKRATCRPQLQKMWKKHRRPRQSPDTSADSHGSLIVLVCGQSTGWLLSFLASFVCKNHIDFRWPRKLPRA